VWTDLAKYRVEGFLKPFAIAPATWRFSLRSAGVRRGSTASPPI
jgi:hypothetical protein